MLQRTVRQLYRISENPLLSYDNTLKEMEVCLAEFQKKRNIEFAKWCGSNYTTDSPEDSLWYDRLTGEKMRTTEELYDEYLQEIENLETR